MFAYIYLRSIPRGLREEHWRRDHFYVCQTYGVMRTVHCTPRSHVLSQNLANFFIGWPSLAELRTNSEHLILHTLTLLRASMLLQLRRCQCHPLLRGLRLFLLFQNSRQARGFRFSLHCCISLRSFSHATSNISLFFRAQSEESELALEIDYLCFFC